MQIIKKFINFFLKIFDLKLIKIVDQFSNSYRLVLSLKENKINYIFDVGANEGQFVKELRYYGYKDEVISFEPYLKAYSKLILNSQKDQKWKTISFDQIKIIFYEFVAMVYNKMRGYY